MTNFTTIFIDRNYYFLGRDKEMLLLFYFFLSSINKSHEKTQTNNVLILPAQPAHWFLLKIYIFKNTSFKTEKKLTKNSWALQFLGNITQTGGSSAFVGDYFQWWINTDLVHYSISGSRTVCVAHWCVFNSFFGQQQSSKAQKNKIYSVLNTHTILVNR